MTLLCNFLNILQKLNTREKSSGRMLFGLKIIFPLEKIRKILKNMHARAWTNNDGFSKVRNSLIYNKCLHQV